MERVLLLSIRVGVTLVLLTPLIVMAPMRQGAAFEFLLPSTFFPFIVGKALFYRTITEIILGLWIVLALRYPSHRPRRSIILLILLAYVGVTLASSVFGVSLQRSLWSTYERMQGFVDVAHWFAYTVVLTSVFRTWLDWRALLNFNLGVSLLMSLLGVAQYLDIRVLMFLATNQRLDITLGNPTYVGAYMLVNVLIGLGFLSHSLMKPAPQVSSTSLIRRRRRSRRGRPEEKRISPETWWRVFWIVVIVLDFQILYLSGTRGAVAGLGAGLLAVAVGYMVWGNVRLLRTASLVLVVGMVGLAAVMIPLRSTSFYRNLADDNVMLARIALTGTSEDAALTGRVNSGLVGLRGFAARPILGWGPENFTIAYDRYVTSDIVASSVTSFDQAHNKPIEELTTKGLVGFSTYVTLWLFMFWVIVRRVRRQDVHDQLFTLFAGAALVGYFVQNLFLFDTPGTVVPFYLLLGYVVFLESSPSMASVDESRPGRSSLGSVKLAVPGMLRSENSAAVSLAVIGIVTLIAIILLNLAPYNGSRRILDTLNPNISWGERLVHFEESIDSFPPLANYPRIVMFNRINTEWDKLEGQEVAAALAAVEKAGQDALNSEPQEWRVHLALAKIYQRAGSIDLAYVARARDLVDEAAQLVPQRIEVIQMLGLQGLVEKDYDAGFKAIDEYVEESPDAAPHFKSLLVSLARSYHAAAESDPSNVEKARPVVRRIEEIGPMTIDSVQVIIQQRLFDEEYDSARRVIDTYLEANPGDAGQFETLKVNIDELASR